MPEADQRGSTLKYAIPETVFDFVEELEAAFFFSSFRPFRRCRPPLSPSSFSLPPSSSPVATSTAVCMFVHREPPERVTCCSLSSFSSSLCTSKSLLLLLPRCCCSSEAAADDAAPPAAAAAAAAALAAATTAASCLKPPEKTFAGFLRGSAGITTAGESVGACPFGSPFSISDVFVIAQATTDGSPVLKK